jgi:putative transposase
MEGTMRRTFQYQIKVSKQSETICIRWFEQCRILYNLALEQRITIYKQSRKSISCYDQLNQLPELKDTFPEFSQVGSQCLQDVIERLDKAFKAFFQRTKIGKAGFPRFKSSDRYNSFTLKQAGWKLEGRYLHLAKIGRLKLHLSRPIEGKIKTITIRRTATGKWFACFSCDEVPTRIFSETIKEIGLDVGIKSFLVDSEGRKVDNPLYLKKSLKVLKVQQRKLCRSIKGSQGRKDARLQVAKTYEKISNQRKDFLHKVANYYIQNNQKIFIEDLKINNMVRNRHLARSIADSSWGTFFSLLNEKAESAGRQVIKVNPNGTSQRCSECGERVQKSLAIRIHCCPFCGCVLDRDHNAAINIQKLGQSFYAPTWDVVNPCVA